jgi:hypothetical protein
VSPDLPCKISLSRIKNFCFGRIFKQPNQIGKYQIEFTMFVVNIPSEKTFIRWQKKAHLNSGRPRFILRI